MNRTLKKILCLFLATLTAVSVGVLPANATAAGSDPEVPINDNTTGNGNYQFDYSASWVHEGGYPSRFYEGDEHWTTNAQFGNNYPWFILRFVGTSVTLYGHKVPSGALADVTIDGKAAGQIDYYHSSRVEKVELFKVTGLENTAHELKVQLIAAKNPAAGDTHEASVDYATVTAPSAEFPVTGVSVARSSLFLETGMSAKIAYSLTPDYATVTPAVSFVSSDEKVAAVSADGTVTAKGEGIATVTVRAEGVTQTASVSVTVKKNNGLLTGYMADDNTRTPSDSYLDILKEHYGTNSVSWSGTAWRNDTVSSRFVLYTKGKEVTNVAVSAGNFTNGVGDTLPAGSVSVSFIADTLAHDSGEMIADVIYGNSKTDMKASSLRSVWVSMKVPADAAPGLYSGEITVTADGGVSLVFPYTLEVIAMNRPDGSASGAQLELWQYPYSVDRYYSGKTTAEYFGNSTEALHNIYLNDDYLAGRRAEVQYYAAAGGRAITVTCVEDPWNSQTPDPYPSMIKWTKKSNGHYAFDYTDFDKWVALNLECGVDGQIKTFSIACWGNKITYFDEKSDKTVSTSLTSGSTLWKRVWREFLTDYMAHTKEKGWFEKVYISMDERGFDEVKNMLDLVESVKDENGVCFKTSLCVFQWDTESLFDRVTDLSLAYGMDADRVKAIADARHAKGLGTTLYTCGAQCSSLRNLPAESLFSMIRCAQRGTDGFLRWALNAYNEDPLHTSYNKNFASGDVFLIYPGDVSDATGTVRSSVRFEKIAEGIRTVAKINALKAISPEMSAAVDTIVATLGTQNGGDNEKEALRVQNELNRAARLAALESLIAEARAENAVALKDVIASAEAASKDSTATDTALCQQSEALAHALSVYRESIATEAPTEVPTEPATEEKTESQTTSPQTESSKPTGCGSVLPLSVLPAASVATTAFALKKKHKKDEE